MEIRVDSLIEGAQKAQGTVIIIDVFRAFTTAAIAFSRGAAKIIMVAEIEEALELRQQGFGDICIGEVGGIRPKGFDMGNSPLEISTANVKNKTLIQSTRAGTLGVTLAQQANQVYTCSFVVAKATSRTILRNRPDLITIVAMGREGKVHTDEDELCALYLRNLLQGRISDHTAIRSLVKSGADSQNFDNPDLPQYHPGDREIALQIDSLPFAMKVYHEDGLLVSKPEYMCR